MRWLLSLTVAGLIVIGGAYTAEAGGKYYKGHHHRHGGHHHGGYYHGDLGDSILLGAAIIGGAILLGELLSQPQHRPHAHYVPPPPPVCKRERVYRYLPDGRIQWGVRTTCY